MKLLRWIRTWLTSLGFLFWFMVVCTTSDYLDQHYILAILSAFMAGLVGVMWLVTHNKLNVEIIIRKDNETA